ncbi:MAG: MFS transporter [Asgard group archaeon]|nr:MFS transporter [Asgard group archaeon]
MAGDSSSVLNDDEVIDPTNSTEEHSSSISNENSSDIKKKNRSRLLYLISIGNATGQSFLFNFFSAFAVFIGVRANQLGFITSIRNLMSSLFQGSIGRLSDKYGRRYFLMGGFFLVFSSLIILIFVDTPVMLIVVSIIQAFSLSIIIPVWSATLGDLTVTEQRARYIGRLSAVGTAISVSLMLALSVSFTLLREAYSTWNLFGIQIENPELFQYLFSFGLAALNFLICIVGIFFLKETRKASRGIKQPSMFIALKNKDFKKFFIINSIFGLIMATMWPIFPIAQVDLLEMNFSQIAIINAIFATSSSLAQFFGGKLGDRIGRKPLIIYSRMAMFTIPVVMIGALLIDNWLLLILSNIIGGSAIGAMTVAQNAYILDLAPDDQMGAYSGLTQVGWGITTFIGSLTAGFIATSIDNQVGTLNMIYITFSVIAFLRFFTSIFYFFITESLTKDKKDKIKLLDEAKKAAKIAALTSSCEDSSTQTK